MNWRIAVDRSISIEANAVVLPGLVDIPDGARGLVLFAHGSGSSRFSPRNNYVARALREAHVGTLLFDLLTAEEERLDEKTRDLRFDILLLTRRLVAATHWAQARPELNQLGLGYFGASTGAAAALCAAACTPAIRAVVSRGGRPDLAGSALAEVRAPTLLIVGGNDQEVLALNRRALAQLACESRLEVVPKATHLFEEPGALEQVASVAARWFVRHLAPPESGSPHNPRLRVS
jgi:putative phosphoribosyl transferase